MSHGPKSSAEENEPIKHDSCTLMLLQLTPLKGMRSDMSNNLQQKGSFIKESCDFSQQL